MSNSNPVTPPWATPATTQAHPLPAAHAFLAPAPAPAATPAAPAPLPPVAPIAPAPKAPAHVPPNPAALTAFCAHFAPRIAAAMGADESPVLIPELGWYIGSNVVLTLEGLLPPMGDLALGKFDPNLLQEYKSALQALYEPIFTDVEYDGLPHTAIGEADNVVTNETPVGGGGEPLDEVGVIIPGPVNPHSQPSPVMSKAFEPLYEKIKTDRQAAGAIATTNSALFPEPFDAMPLPQVESIFAASHKLYEKGDAGLPKEIQDSNGDVVLSLCKLCGAGESELFDAPCPHALAEAEIKTRASSPAYKTQGAIPVFNFEDAEGVSSSGYPSNVEVMVRFDVSGWFTTLQGYNLEVPEYKGTGRKPTPTRHYEVSAGYWYSVKNAVEAAELGLQEYLKTNYPHAMGLCSYGLRLTTSYQKEGCTYVCGVWDRTPYASRVFMEANNAETDN